MHNAADDGDVPGRFFLISPLPLNPQEHSIRLIVGLGNVGAEYERTRHNAGFWFVDSIARKAGAAFARAQFHGETARLRDGGRELWLLKRAPT